MTHFIYVMDPMCSWCWAFAPAIGKLRRRYPDAQWTLIMGGLAPDSEEPMAMSMQEKLISIWQHIQQKTGTPFNYSFWENNTPRRSTYPACRAVLAATAMSESSAFPMIQAIQQAYYLDAQNPSDTSILINLAEQIGLDREQFSAHLNSNAIQQQLEQNMAHAQQLGAQGFPSLFLATEEGAQPLSYGYCDPEELLQRLEGYKSG